MDFIVKNLKDIDIKFLINNKMLIAGLDIGDKRVGISISDMRFKIATGIDVFTRKNNDSDFVALADILKKHNVGLIIFGWPLQMNGRPGEQCGKNTEFMQKLLNHIDIDCSPWDERFSSSVSEKVLIAADISRKKRKNIIDKTAAVYILQGALDFLNRRLNIL